MRRLPGYRRGSFVLHLFAFAFLLVGGLFGAGDVSERRIAYAAVPARPDLPPRRNEIAHHVQHLRATFRPLASLFSSNPMFGDALTHDDDYDECVRDDGDALTHDDPYVDGTRDDGDALTHDDSYLDLTRDDGDALTHDSYVDLTRYDGDALTHDWHIDLTRDYGDALTRDAYVDLTWFDGDALTHDSYLDLTWFDGDALTHDSYFDLTRYDGDALTHDSYLDLTWFDGDALTHDSYFDLTRYDGDALTHDWYIDLTRDEGDALTHDDAYLDMSWDRADEIPSSESWQSATPLAKLDTIIPAFRTSLEPNYPNPVRSVTRIWFSVERTMMVTIRVYDYFYNQVEVLVDNEQFDAGRHFKDFFVGPPATGIVFSGMYFYEMRAEGQVFTRRMMVIK